MAPPPSNTLPTSEPGLEAAAHVGYARTEGYLTHLRGYGTHGALRIEGILNAP
jgi:hypothetical protein